MYSIIIIKYSRINNNKDEVRSGNREEDHIVVEIRVHPSRQSPIPLSHLSRDSHVHGTERDLYQRGLHEY